MSQYVQYATDDDLEADLAGAGKPVAYNTAEGLPFSLLTDRQFECLLHDIATALLVRKDESRFGKYDRAVLMQGVGERGRDCALIRDGKHVGAIQCKKHQGLLTKPDAAREIIKYCLHALKDPELMPEPKGFKYVFAVSRDFNEKAKTLLNAFSRLVEKEESLLAWTKEVVDEYRSLSDISPEQIQPKLLAMLKDIDVAPVAFNELNTLLEGETSIIAKYFTVKMVIDPVGLDAIGQKIDLIAKSLGDVDTRRLLDALNAQPPERRVDFGLFSLWGYPRRFIDDLMRDRRFRQFGSALAMAKTEVDVMFAEHLKDWVANEIFANVTSRRIFSPLVVSAAFPYLTGRVLDRWRTNQLGSGFSAAFPRSSIAPDPISLRKQLLEEGQRFLNGDWSAYVGAGEILALKKRMAHETYGRYREVTEMAHAFDDEWPRLVPILHAIEARLEAQIPTDTTVVLRSMRWLDDRSHVKDIFSTVKSFDGREGGHPVAAHPPAGTL